MNTEPDGKVCRVCGRRFAWRAKWARDWPNVRHCSRRCSGRGLRRVDQSLEEAIEELIAERAGKTVCPSEAAQRVARDDDWRALMEPARMAARRLYHRGRVRIRQRGHDVDPDHMKGPVRLAPPDA